MKFIVRVFENNFRQEIESDAGWDPDNDDVYEWARSTFPDMVIEDIVQESDDCLDILLEE